MRNVRISIDEHKLQVDDGGCRITIFTEPKLDTETLAPDTPREYQVGDVLGNKYGRFEIAEKKAIEYMSKK